MAYHGALADDAAAAHYHGTVTLLLLLAQVAFLAAPLLRFFVSVRQMILSHPGHFVYQYTEYRVGVNCVARVQLCPSTHFRH